MLTALIDWHWQGHHPTYFTHFAAAMAEADADVVPFCANPEDCLSRLDSMSLPRAVTKRIGVAERMFPPVSAPKVLSACGEQYAALRFFWGMGRRLRRWERIHGRKIDLVFFACIYEHEFRHFHRVRRFFGLPWTGLYLHARWLRGDARPAGSSEGAKLTKLLFGVPECRGVALLDEGMAGVLKQIVSPRPVEVFPDVTMRAISRESGAANGLAAKVKDFARGRPVVSLTGHLQKSKGIEAFTEAALRREMKEVLFFLGGHASWWGFDDSQRRRLEGVWEKAPNIYAHLQALPEQTLNEVVATSDVVAAAYVDFPNSSNIMTKAAMLERPIVVSDGHLMAERVRDYKLGEVVPENDAAALAGAIRLMVEPGYYEGWKREARCREYAEVHSVARLRHVMADFLSKL